MLLFSYFYVETGDIYIHRCVFYPYSGMCVLSYPYLCWAPNSQWFPVVRDKLINPILTHLIRIPIIQGGMSVSPISGVDQPWHIIWRDVADTITYIYTYIYMHIFALECGKCVLHCIYKQLSFGLRPRRPPYHTLTTLGPRLEDVFLNWLMSRRALVSFRDVSDGFFPRGTHGNPWWL